MLARRKAGQLRLQRGNESHRRQGLSNGAPTARFIIVLPAWLSSDSSSFVNCRAIAPRECKFLRRPHFEGRRWIEKSLSVRSARGQAALPSAPSFVPFAPVAQLPERDASNVGDACESPAGSARFGFAFGVWGFGLAAQATRNSRLARAALAQQQRRPAQNGKVEGASPSRGTNF